MFKESYFPNAEIEPLAESLATTFIQRDDLHSRQLDDGRYVCVHQPLQPDHIKAHLSGEITLGAYLLDQDSHARYVVLDADDDAQMDGLMGVSQSLKHHRIPSYLEVSRRGGHLWLFFEKPVDGSDARIFGQGVLAWHELDGIELYPKQDRLKSGPGSLIRLPFGIHRKSGQRYSFITTEGERLAASMNSQIQALSAPQTVSDAAFDTFWVRGQMDRETPEYRAASSSAATLSGRIKDAVSVHDFVAEYVQLNHKGQGLCPFHDDHNPSFSVNLEENYWHCFAGCGGGSIIDFWMKWNNMGFSTAVRELRNVILGD